MQNLLSKLQRKLLIIIVAIGLSFAVTSVLQHTESTQIQKLSSTTTITISNETTFGTPFKCYVEKGYFDSIGEVYVYMSSPYANYWNTFSIWMSSDNSSWKVVPFLESSTDNRTQMASLGRINLGDPQLIIYQKYFVPPQTIYLPSNVTKEDASVLTSYVLIRKQATPADTGLWIFSFFTVFGVSGFILDFIFSEKNATSSARGSRKRRKRESKSKARREQGK